MKCPKCRQEMQRQKTKDRSFRYVCPNCKNVVSANKK